MTEPKKPSYTLEFTHAAIPELEKLDSNVRRKVFSDIEKTLAPMAWRRWK